MKVPTSPMELNSKKWFIDYCQEIERDANVRKEIIESNEFMLWLMSILLDKKYVDTLNYKDNVNINKLRVLYKILDEYAYKRYVSSYEENGSRYYYFEYDGYICKIGFVLENSDIYFCHLVDDDVSNISLFSFADISREENELSSNAIVKEELSKLEDYIRRLKNQGISSEDIIETTAKALNLVKK